MFSVINTHDIPNDRWSKIKYNLFNPAPKISRVQSENAEAFFSVDYTGDKFEKHIPFLKAKLGEGFNHIVTADAQIKHALCEQIFTPEVLPIIVLINLCRDCLSINKKYQKKKLKITVKDESGFAAAYIDEIVPFAGLIRVITHNDKAYREASSRIMLNYGAVLLIAEEDECAAGSDILISPHPTIQAIQDVDYVICCDVLASEKVFSLNSTSLKSKFDELIPEQIDKLTFLSALFEQNGVDELSGLSCCSLIHNGSDVNLLDMNRILIT